MHQLPRCNGPVFKLQGRNGCCPAVDQPIYLASTRRLQNVRSEQQYGVRHVAAAAAYTFGVSKPCFARPEAHRVAICVQQVARLFERMCTARLLESTCVCVRSHGVGYTLISVARRRTNGQDARLCLACDVGEDWELLDKMHRQAM